jgi:hypothetical protein
MPSSYVNREFKFLKVYLAFTNNMQNVLETTHPILLFPGTHLVGLVNLIIRRRFRAPGVSSFGIFDVSQLRCTNVNGRISIKSEAE